MGQFHPERPARLGAVSDALIEAGLADLLRHYQAPLVSRQQLERVHDRHYLDYVEGHAPATGLWPLDHETIMNPFTLEAARRAAGAAVRAVDLVLTGEADNVFCNIRPPGHHAERSQGMGFCFFNNIAVAAAQALQHEDIRRVLIVDFDLHHGNGTEDIFRECAEVMICSSFQHPNYPDKPFALDDPRIINVTLPAGAGSGEFRALVSQQWLPAIDAFQPDFFFISAGFDAHGNDPLSALRLTAEDYYWVTGRLVELADRHAGGRIVSCLEGGYDLTALGLSAAAHVRALMKL